MRRSLFIVSIVLTILFTASSICYAADTVARGDCSFDNSKNSWDTTVHNVKWELDSEGVLTVSGTGAMEDYDEGELTPWIGYNDKIKKIIIKSGVTSVGEYAFCGCKSLTDLVVEEGVKELDSYSFKNCPKLKNVTLPSSVRALGYDTFRDCPNITNCYLTDFEGWMEKDGLLNNSSGSLPLGNRNIDNNQFGNIYVNGNLVTTITIPEGTVEYGSPYWNGNSYYLYGAAFDKLIVPVSLEKIELIGCYFDKVMIRDLSAWCRVRRNCDYYVHYVNNLYLNDKKVTSLTIPEDVTAIAQGAFYGFGGIEKVNIPETVTYIGENAFGNMKNAEITYKGTSSSAIENIWDFKTTGTTANSVTISWPRLTNASSYKIFVKEAGGWKLRKTINDPETNKYTITKLNSNNSVQVKVVAKVDGITYTCEGETYCTKPKKVENVRLTTKSKSVTVTWGHASYQGYQVQIATNKAFTKGKKTYTIKDDYRLKKITNLTKGKKYYVRVRAVNYKVNYPESDSMKQYGAWSDIKTITCR